MAARYSRLPNPSGAARISEMEAAFDDSDDENESDEELQTTPLVSRESRETSPQTPGQYDFERVDYDYPPPGSPPRPSALALPANAVYGNTNGFIPSNPVERPKPHTRRHRGGWFERFLPSWASLPTSRSRPGRVGGGGDNDGVFANLMSKPTRPRQIEDGDGIHIAPEETQAEAPPSYATAQADAVPSYWETTVHAPAGGDIAGELIVDSLPTGSLFSFLWSMLVSVAFNFLGFVLTYLLHTTHAAKYGSRAGLGITLIQYGWALRTRADNLEGSGFLSDDTDSPGDMMRQHRPASAAEAKAWFQQYGNATIPEPTPDTRPYMLGESAAAWLSFFLMTVGWFLFLSSVLGFWRVKRWEKGILEAQVPAPQPVHEDPEGHDVPISFSFPGILFRESLGLNTSRRQDEEQTVTGERFVLQEIDRQRQIAEVRINDARLQRNLRSAGLI